MHRQPMTPIQIGGLLLALAMVLACCLGVCVLSVFAPADPPSVVSDK